MTIREEQQLHLKRRRCAIFPLMMSLQVGPPRLFSPFDARLAISKFAMGDSSQP